MAKLYFYYSAMNAGKSTTLLQTDYNYQERGMKTLLYTPIFDDRFEAEHVSSRIGLKAKAICFDHTLNFYDDVKKRLEEVPYKFDCVLVDEAHFLSKNQVNTLCQVVDYTKTPVLCYGLRSDFLGEPFEGSQYLLTWADKLVEIKTVCHCGKKATMNMRLDANKQKVTAGQQVEIGGNDLYTSTCRRHFIEGVSGLNT